MLILKVKFLICVFHSKKGLLDLWRHLQAKFEFWLKKICKVFGGPSFSSGAKFQIWPKTWDLGPNFWPKFGQFFSKFVKWFKSCNFLQKCKTRVKFYSRIETRADFGLFYKFGQCPDKIFRKKVFEIFMVPRFDTLVKNKIWPAGGAVGQTNFFPDWKMHIKN